MTFALVRAAARLQAALPAYLDDLERIVSIDSGTFDKEGVDKVASFFEERYQRLGAHVERHGHATLGDTLIINLRGHGSGKVLLLGHTDTVYPAGTARARPFHVDADRAYGPGTADMKAGDLSILYAVELLLAEGKDVFGQVTVVHNSDEEIGSPESRDLIHRLSSEVDVSLILEAGRENGNIVSARKGVADVELVVRGVAAHAGVNHDRGRSAILGLAHLIVELEGMNGSIPGVTLNVGRVDAGERSNVVPDYAFARLELRATERARLEEAIECVKQLVLRPPIPGTSAEVRVSVSHWPMHRSAEIVRLVALARRLGSELNLDVQDTATGGASDGNTASAAGCPVLDGLGPVGSGAHSTEEFIRVSSIVPRTALLSGLVASLSTHADF